MAWHTPSSEGIFPSHWMRQAVAEGLVSAGDCLIPDLNFQPASLDLRLGPVAHRVRCSFLSHDKPVTDKVNDVLMDTLDIRNGAVLERGRPYLIPLMEELELPPHVYARTNPRSSTGRLDIFTRVITDYNDKFDEIKPGYHGKMYMEIVSRSFTIYAKAGISLNQLRLLHGNYIPAGDQSGNTDYNNPLSPQWGNSVYMSIDLSGEYGSLVGYKAKKNSELLDLSRVNAYDVEDFWDPVVRERQGRIVLEPEEFYLLLSSETVAVPPDYAAEMVAYVPTSGELRTHYAGFFDPGFGYNADGVTSLGSRAVLEVRAHDVPFMVETGQNVCRLDFQSMAETASVLYGSDVGSSYQYQELTLSKHFRRNGSSGNLPQRHLL